MKKLYLCSGEPGYRAVNSDEAAGSQTYIQKKGAAVLLLPTSNNQKPTNYDTKVLCRLKESNLSFHGGNSRRPNR